MKASICDFCGGITQEKDQKATLFDVVISSAEGYQIDSKAERAILFDAEDVCIRCATRAHAVLGQLKKELAKK